MRKPRTPAWVPATYDVPDIAAVKALQAGTATADQQKRALDWVITQAAGTYEPSFYSDADGGDRETAFAEGRRYVGLQLVKLLNLSHEVVEALRSKNA